MNERNFKANANEGSNMLRTEHDKYRRAFWIAATGAVALAIVASVLWWRLSHAGTTSQTGNMQETPLAPIQLTPQRMQSIGIVLGRVESKHVSSDLRLYGNVQVDERRQAYVQTRF